MPESERLHVKLSDRAANSLARAMAATTDTKTDTVNRALVLYCQLIDQAGEGIEFLTRRPGQRAERLHLL